MDIAVLEKKVSNLTQEQQANIESYIDFLLQKNKDEQQVPRKPLDFSKYDTATHIWHEDAQDFVKKARANDRF